MQINTDMADAQAVKFVRADDAEKLINREYSFLDELRRLSPGSILEDGTYACPACEKAMTIEPREKGVMGRCHGSCNRPIIDVVRLYCIRQRLHYNRATNTLAAQAGYVVTRFEAKADVDRQKELVIAALNYAARGMGVFPVYNVQEDGQCSCGNPGCRDTGKHPILKHGLNDATTDPERIREWWSWKPHANIGIRTGSKSGIFVVDVDCADDKPGFETLRELENSHGELPPTWQVKTGSGGLHIYFQMPTGVSIKSGTNVLGPGMDVRGEGGYVIAPPSNHASGRHYGQV